MFKIGLHIKDSDLLNKIKTFFGIGRVTFDIKNNSCTYRVHELDNIVKYILPHFNKYSLLSNKLADYLLLKKIVLLMYNDKSHLTKEGLQTILNLRASLNNGLRYELAQAFPLTVPVPRALVSEAKQIDNYWIAGFVSGVRSRYF